MNSAQTRVAVAARPGPADQVVAIQTVLLEPRQPMMVRVRMLAAAINPSDLITISGAYARTVFPFVGGFEGVGVVVDADSVTGLRPGRRVIPIRQPGAWATLRDVPAVDCVPVPASLPTDQAATAFVNPLTALVGVDRHVTDSRPVVITAASSTIADHFAALLQQRGVPAIGVIRRATSRVRRPELWAALISADDPGWRQQLHHTAAGAAVIFDAVGGLLAAEVASAVPSGAKTLVSYGLLSGQPIPETMLPVDTTLRYLHLREVVHAPGAGVIDGLFARVFALLDAGVLQTDIAQRFPFEAIRDALRWAAGHSGKALLEFPATLSDQPS